MPDRRTAVAFTVVVDRVIGLIALVLFGGVLAAFRLPLLMSTPHTKAFTLTFYLFVIGAAVGSVLASLGPYVLNRPFFVKLARKLPMAHRGAKLYAAYDRSARAPGHEPPGADRLGPLAPVDHDDGLLHHAGDGIAGEPARFCSIVAIVNLLIAMPVSISGIGIREVLFPMFLALIEVPADKAGTFAITYFALCTHLEPRRRSLYFLYRQETHTPPPDTDSVEPIFEQ